MNKAQSKPTTCWLQIILNHVIDNEQKPESSSRKMGQLI